MTLLGSQFSPVFADVILLTDAITLSIVAGMVFYDEITGFCGRMFHHAWALLGLLATYLRPRHR